MDSEGGPGMQRPSSLTFGSPFSEQAAMTYAMLTSTAAADYLFKFADMGHAATFGLMDGS